MAGSTSYGQCLVSACSFQKKKTPDTHRFDLHYVFYVLGLLAVLPGKRIDTIKKIRSIFERRMKPTFFT